MSDFMTQSASQAYIPPSHILCRFCEKPIFVGDRAVYFHHGVVGRGPKSGQPVVTDGDHTTGEAVVHETCAPSFLTMEIVDSAEDLEGILDSLTEDIFGRSYSDIASEEPICTMCEAKLDDD